MTPTGKRIVVLGMMAKLPVPGVVWQTLHYLQGLQRLGFEPFYVEANARTPSMLMERDTDDGSGRAAALIARVMEQYGMPGRWAYHALHEYDGRCYGLSERELRALYRDAALIINLHGGTEPRPEFGDRLVYLETDPVQLQIELHDEVATTEEFLRAHSAFFTFAENLGRPGCTLPVCERFDFLPTRQPVVLDHWSGEHHDSEHLFTTVGNWQQGWRTVNYGGEAYGWSKDQQWLKFLDVPARTGESFELALSGYRPHHREQLEAKGWRVRPALDFGTETEAYRDYIAGSRGEFTVAKEQNVRFATGWFSDRSATYLAAGRPVITQDTAFGCALPTGEGLYAVSDIDEAAAAVEAVNADYSRNRRAAREIAREFFDAERVLGDLLDAVGISSKRTATAPAAKPAVAAGRSRHAVGPRSSVLALIPHFKCEEWLDDCLESLERQTRPLDGIVVIDDCSDSPPVHIVERYPSVTLMHAAENVGPYRLIQQVIEDTSYDAYMFQDADDWSAPDRLELLLEHAGETGAELIGAQEIRVFCDEPEVAQIEWPLDVNAPFAERPTAFPLLHPTSLVSRDLVMAMGGFSSGLRFGGDAEFLRRAHHIARCVNVPAFSYYRRVRQGSLTTAPATAIGTPPRKRVMEMTFARAKRNVELVAAGQPPDLSPCETAPPVVLTRLCGPALRGPDTPAASPPRRKKRSARRSAQPSEPGPRPVFVVGADRSGVSALACALGQHPQLAPATGAGVLGALAERLVATHEGALAEDPSALGVEAQSVDDFCAAFGAAASARVGAGCERWVDGSWQNAGHEVALAALFPEARFIHVVRGVDSAVTALADPPLGSAGATGGTQIPVRLRTKLSQADALARWLDMVSACATSHETLGDERMLQVTYAELLTDPAALVRRCLDFVGESDRHECMRPLRELRARMKVEPLKTEDPAERALLERARELSRSLTESGPIFIPPEAELPVAPPAPPAVEPRPEIKTQPAP
ncbi:MAG: hypothetical protein QOI98_1104, partial [Solirubrobacteraceae bacterium]|nr:hypothetical protein [Solirubrobacteraceae bacterium]